MALKLGLLADEFFEPSVGRMGGFGWAARQVARLFSQHSEAGVRVVFLTARPVGYSGLGLARIHDTRLRMYDPGRNGWTRLRRENFDVLLTIDYRPRYRAVLECLASVPVLVWVRDPRPPDVLTRIATLRVPTASADAPQGIATIDCRSLSRLVVRGGRNGRPFLFATPAPSLGSRIEATYGLSGVQCGFLPNIVDIEAGVFAKHPSPRVIFLGRLDPIKRPWLFVELARRFPDVEFLMLGQAHFHGPGAWTADNLPANVRLLGHIDGKLKRELLRSAWVLVNTSIHEALATSFLEALACEVPLLGCTNQEGVVACFGIFTGEWDGDGMHGLPAFVEGLRRLLADRLRREYLGQRGRSWVEDTHTGENFLRAFASLCRRIGVDAHRGAMDG